MDYDVKNTKSKQTYTLISCRLCHKDDAKLYLITIVKLVNRMFIKR